MGLRQGKSNWREIIGFFFLYKKAYDDFFSMLENIARLTATEIEIFYFATDQL